MISGNSETKPIITVPTDNERFRINPYKNLLKTELDNQFYLSLWDEVVQSCSMLSSFKNWNHLIDWLHTPSNEDKNEILQALFISREGTPCQYWDPIFTLVFWPTLKTQYYRYLKLDVLRKELWHELLLSFIVTVRNFKVKDQQTAVLHLVKRDTFLRLKASYARRWRELKALEGYDSPVDVDSYTPDDAYVEIEIGRQIRFMLYSGYLSGQFSDKDLSFLIAKFFKNKSIAEYARTYNLSYEAEKKREARVFRKMRHGTKRTRKKRIKAKAK